MPLTAPAERTALEELPDITDYRAATCITAIPHPHALSDHTGFSPMTSVHGPACRTRRRCYHDRPTGHKPAQETRNDTILLARRAWTRDRIDTPWDSAITASRSRTSAGTRIIASDIT
ncbi:hypothetical protein GCM10010497_23680 [Streptomyces cinereoruber]|uniref:Uncharacterized protein n=1 Tax=Streptomyces cinereoruber TaxID=67260 RepID=A0AAV4KIN3_9ACTN|nr:hypothetical protein GCM10010497_23680 [Streptomyces cinereoruber]